MASTRAYPGNTWCLPPQEAIMSIPLYKSRQGNGFVGYSGNLKYGNGTSAWCALANPIESGVVFHVSLFAVTDFTAPPIDVQIWFNSQLPGQPVNSKLVAPNNTGIYPPLNPRVELRSASNAIGFPKGGVNAFARRSIPGETISVDEDGKFIFPPGGVFAIFLTNTLGVSTPGTVRVAFQWWEERINAMVNSFK